jgi:ABC-type sugar transport system permease subunit
VSPAASIESAADAGAARAVGRRRRRRALLGPAFLVPAIALFLLFVAYPVEQTFRLSLYDWDGISPEKSFVGLRNFGELFHRDPYFWHTVKNTLLWAAVTIPVTMILGLALAIMLDRKLRFRNVYRTAFFVPVVMSAVVIGAVWNWLYDPTFGLVNSTLGHLGLGADRVWLADPSLALWAAIAANVWRWTGLTMLFYLAALQSIPPDLYQAARVDGASEWAQVRRITLPLLKPMTALLLLLGTIGAFKEFEIIYILTGGGPAHTTDLLSTQIFYNGFKISRSGYAAAISVVLLVGTVLVALVELEYLNRKNRELG